MYDQVCGNGKILYNANIDYDGNCINKLSNNFSIKDFDFKLVKN